MQSYSFDGTTFHLSQHEFTAAELLPSNSILLDRTPLTYSSHEWENFYQACHALRQQIDVPGIVFIDGSWDPIPTSNEEIVQRRSELQQIFTDSKVLILSSRCQHFYDNIPGCVYFPMFLMVNYPDLVFKPRAGRIGCLNRGNRPHRTLLMHHLLEQELIDPSKDIYSVNFKSLYTDTYWDVDFHIGTNWFNQAQLKWPPQIATHPDNFPNDYSIEHPAWHTGISIITETEPGFQTIISEKTGKGILSKSCFSVYMAEAGYRVLEDLGFSPRFFNSHAEDYNIEPLIELCQTIQTEQQALDYRQQHMDQIEHNFHWFGFRCGAFATRPWFSHYGPKLQQALASL